MADHLEPVVTLDPRAAMRAAVTTLLEGVALPVLLDSGATAEALEVLMSGYHLRVPEQGGQVLATGGAVDQRGPLAGFRARRQRMASPLLTSLLRQELYHIARLNAGPRHTGDSVPVQVFDEWLDNFGWSFGTRRRSAALHEGADGGWILDSSRRWYAPGPVPPPFTPEEARQHGLSRWLGMLVRTVYQRFLQLEGSFLRTIGFILTPEQCRAFVDELADWSERWLRRHHLPWYRLPRGREAELAHFQVGLLGGAVEVPGLPATAAGREMLLVHPGADLGRRIGGVDLAGWTLQRSCADGILARLEEAATAKGIEVGDAFDGQDAYARVAAIARAAGIDLEDFVRSRFGLGLSTLRNWLAGPRIDPESGDERPNGGPVGMASVHLLDMLVEAHPRRLPEQEVFRRMRERHTATLSNKAVVEVALTRLEADDLIEKTVEHGARYFRSRRSLVDRRIVDWKMMKLGLVQYLRPLPGLVEQVLADHPAARGWSEAYVVPRALLPELELGIKNQAQQLHAQNTQPNQGVSDDELLASGHVRCTILVQGCTSSVHLKLSESRYR